MLAKIWKKALLAICILACIYNVMYKLVNRTSLDEQLKSVVNQSNLLEMLDNKKESTENKSNSTTNETQNETSKENTIVVIY